MNKTFMWMFVLSLLFAIGSAFFALFGAWFYFALPIAFFGVTAGFSRKLDVKQDSFIYIALIAFIVSASVLGELFSSAFVIGIYLGAFIDSLIVFFASMLVIMSFRTFWSSGVVKN